MGGGEGGFIFLSFPHTDQPFLLAGLRVVHTVAESILETTQEEDRRRFKRAASRKESNGDGIKPKRTLFGRRKRADTVTSSRHGHAEEEEQDPTIEVGYEERAELERMRTRANAAAESEESARRQEKQDAEERKKSAKKRGKKEKGRRVVYVNVEGAKTDPRGYERNKVRTSKYTAVSFLPKVRSIPIPSLYSL
jgi:phospholipid-translocating ATPase